MESIQEHRKILQESVWISLLESAASSSAESHPFLLGVADLPPVPVLPALDHDQEQ
jgi:hypothetical protein